MTGLVDRGRAVGIAYLEFSKACDTASCKILIEKVLKYGHTVRWIENWRSGQTQSVVIGDRKSSLKPVTSGVPQGSTLFNICINDLDDGSERNLSKFASDTEPRGVTDTPEHCAAIQRDVNRLEKWASRNLMRFRKRKCKVLHWGEEQTFHDGGHPARTQLFRKGPGGPGGNEIDHEPALYPCSKEG
ncbi:mitochondrial enolase superfamily member 1 [Grus japonensis]|uniref:Mitochondrial enolase superfamily member 1 n=1 Tax=Grus japonensis TaxID=30415 RepID=A0ABC9Y4Q0_GRUJA